MDSSCPGSMSIAEDKGAFLCLGVETCTMAKYANSDSENTQAVNRSDRCQRQSNPAVADRSQAESLVDINEQLRGGRETPDTHI